MEKVSFSDKLACMLCSEKDCGARGMPGRRAEISIMFGEKKIIECKKRKENK